MEEGTHTGSAVVCVVGGGKDAILDAVARKRVTEKTTLE